MNLPKLIALGDYSEPALPTEAFFRGAWTRLRRRLSANDRPALQESVLKRAPLAIIDDLAEPPDCDSLLEALDEQLGAWARDAGNHSRLLTLVVPPCDTNGTLATWAKRRGHALLPEVDRLDLLAPHGNDLHPDLGGEGLLVIPRLEHWVLRQRNGLHAMRALLARLACSERRCLVGCSSWAWRFVVKSAGADLALPPPHTFEPFDARRLRDWFARLARDDDDGAAVATFRLAGDGDDVLACDEDGEPRHAYLRQLAARSGGIPWVAWHLWRASLKVSAGDEPLSASAAAATANDARTVWVVDVDDVELPTTHEDQSLLVLHALMIHGTLTSAEVEAVLPTTGEPDVLAALVRSGHLQREDASGKHHVRPSAYPAVRRSLQSAGFPTGAM